MKKKKNSSSIIIGCTLGSVLLACGAALAVTFSWFSNGNNVTRAIEGNTAGAYFASGKGTEDDPYIINKPVHLYNLAWLQYIGYFNKDNDNNNEIDSQYYFKLGADITMTSEWTLPPIGTEQYPFIGNFDGNDHTISGLKISTQIGTGDGYITKHPSNVTETSFNNANINIVGFFGIIGSTTSGTDTSSYTYGGTTYTYTSSINSVKGVYLDDVTINAYATNTLCGMLAGYVNGELTNSGVHYGSLKLASGVTNISGFTNVSSYTLIGDYNKEKYKWETTPGGSGSGDDGYGTSTNIREMYEKLKGYSEFMSGTTLTIPKSYAIPIKYDSTKDIVNGSSTSHTVTTSGNELTPANASTLPVASNIKNIGYYSGGEVKAYEDYFDSTNVDFSNMKTAGNSQISVSDDTEHIEKIKTYLKTEESNGHRLGDSAMVLSGTYFGDGSSATSFPSSKDNYLIVENAQVGSWKGNLLIPARGIWVAPTTPGTFEFVGINTKNSGFLTNASISVIRLKRSTPKDYSSGFSNVTYTQGTDFTNDMCGCTIYGGSNAYVPYYFGVTVTQEDIDNGYEFFITKYASDMLANPYIVYIDVGTDGGGSSTDEKTYSWSFDFVDKDSSDKIIKINDTSYKKTNLSFVISGTSTTACSYYFRRTGGTTVYYFIDPTTTGFTITADGTTSNALKAKDSDCSEADTTSN